MVTRLRQVDAVMGASVFPQNAGYNPTGTVGALAYWYIKSPGPLVWARLVDAVVPAERSESWDPFLTERMGPGSALCAVRDDKLTAIEMSRRVV